MKGTNELRLSQAAICEAIQYWLTNTVMNKDNPSPYVTKVLSDRGNGYTDEFCVTLSETPPA